MELRKHPVWRIQRKAILISAPFMFEKLKSAKAVFDFLQGCINKPLTAIRAMDFPDPPTN
jgi:hypothetical protein